MGRAKGWTCQKQTKGKVCKFHNPPRTRKCGKCGKTRPVKRKPAHMVGLELDYEGYIALNGGEVCGICGATKRSRNLDRDHDHTTGSPRGLLCVRCNRALARWMTIEWLKAALAYLERASNLT